MSVSIPESKLMSHVWLRSNLSRGISPEICAYLYSPLDVAIPLMHSKYLSSVQIYKSSFV